MPSCCENFSTAKSIISRLRKLFRGPHEGVAGAPGSLIAIGEDQISQTAEPSSPPPSVNENAEQRPVGGVQWDQPPLPPNCSRLNLGDVEIPGDHPTRAGAFTDVWDGSLDGGRVVIKSYRIYSTGDPTQARMVRFRWISLNTSDSSATEVL